jgi:environmental stress-induced protein Ves
MLFFAVANCLEPAQSQRVNSAKLSIHGPDSYRTVPWRNGRGETLVLRSAAAPGTEDFAWRLSIATVDCDGPFSHFPHCDRILILLDGSGLTLTHDNGQVATLGKRFSSAEFCGDGGTLAKLHDGPVLDFNVMTHRDHCSASVTVLEGDDAKALAVDCELLLIYAVDTHVAITAPQDESIAIAQHHLLQYESPAPGHWRFSGGPVFVMQISKPGNSLRQS